MLSQEHLRLIDRYETQIAWFSVARQGLTEQQLQAYPVPGTWSIKQILIHLADSDAIGAFRMKRVIAEPSPTYNGYDESLFAQRLDYQTLSLDLAEQLFTVARTQLTEILRRLVSDDFDRIGFHNEDGQQSLGKMLDKYVQHMVKHFEHVQTKRQLLGHPLNLELNL